MSRADSSCRTYTTSTLSDLYESRKRIIVSRGYSPKEFPGSEERLRSRFAWGLVADIQPSDFETRVAILKKKAALLQVRIAGGPAHGDDPRSNRVQRQFFAGASLAEVGRAFGGKDHMTVLHAVEKTRR